MDVISRLPFRWTCLVWASVRKIVKPPCFKRICAGRMRMGQQCMTTLVVWLYCTLPPQLSCCHLIRITCLQPGPWGVHGRDRLPGHRLVPFPGFHVVGSNRKDRVNCLVDREEYLDRTWILCSLADENKRFVVLSMRLIIFQK